MVPARMSSRYTRHQSLRCGSGRRVSGAVATLVSLAAQPFAALLRLKVNLHSRIEIFDQCGPHFALQIGLLPTDLTSPPFCPLQPPHDDLVSARERKKHLIEHTDGNRAVSPYLRGRIKAAPAAGGKIVKVW
jgi:hypothetical protein